MTITLFIVCLAVALFALVVVRALATSNPPEPFDGGFANDNETRITKVRGTYIKEEAEGEQM